MQLHFRADFVMRCFIIKDYWSNVIHTNELKWIETEATPTPTISMVNELLMRIPDDLPTYDLHEHNKKKILYFPTKMKRKFRRFAINKIRSHHSTTKPNACSLFIVIFIIFAIQANANTDLLINNGHVIRFLSDTSTHNITCSLSYCIRFLAPPWGLHRNLTQVDNNH